MEALTFLVNNLGSAIKTGDEVAMEDEASSKGDIDFKTLREAFRALDTENLGMLSM